MKHWCVCSTSLFLASFISPSRPRGDCLLTFYFSSSYLAPNISRAFSIYRSPLIIFCSLFFFYSFILFFSGDFAILFEMGMRRQQAVRMVVLLWVLSLMGLVVGVSIGSIKEVSPWIYCFTAGVFLYLALVDLVRASRRNF